MTKINLRKYYPDFYTTDCIIEVPDELLYCLPAMWDHGTGVGLRVFLLLSVGQILGNRRFEHSTRELRAADDERHGTVFNFFLQVKHLL